MARVVWRYEAAEDLREIIRYINQFDPRAARGIGARLFDVGESLKIFPNRGRLLTDGTREMTTVVPYILRYEVVGEQVFILSIRHGARAPR